MSSSKREEELFSRLGRLLDDFEASMGSNIHAKRLHRAFSSRPSLFFDPDLEAVDHFVSRLDVFAEGLVEAAEARQIDAEGLAELTNLLRDICREVLAKFDNHGAEPPVDHSEKGNSPHIDKALAARSSFLNRFGRTRLDRVEERDIDLLLLEEFTSEPALPAFFARIIVGNETELEFLEMSNSVSTASGGESDLIALYRDDQEIVSVLIENKISAPFMPNQAKRYHKRGRAGIKNGDWDRYVTCLLAPKSYIEGDHGEHVFEHEVAYEQLLPHFEAQCGTTRGQWRRALIEQAIVSAKTSNWVRVVDEAVSRFFRAYRKYASQNFPSLRMPHEKDRPATNTWVRFRPDVGLPNRVSLYHKARYGTVDIQVSSCRVEDLHNAIGHLLAPEMHLEQTGKSSVVRIMVPEIDASRDFEAEKEKVHQALQAADKLRTLLSEKRASFAQL